MYVFMPKILLVPNSVIKYEIVSLLCIHTGNIVIFYILYTYYRPWIRKGVSAILQNLGSKHIILYPMAVPYVTLLKVADTAF